MPGDRYEKYGRPTEPADLNAEYMTVQETAFVLKCSVPTVHRRLDELGIKKKTGRRVVTNKADRAALLESSLVPSLQGRAKAAKPRKRGAGRKPLAQPQAALAA
ncbi:DNA-binding protein [Streptomyces sp. NPDC096030]|uniref:DNA-binding protein n=1 Tax=Streptomyces sp. NPDC096030 TaxID=3155423 RepID=UPI00331697B6